MKPDHRRCNGTPNSVRQQKYRQDHSHFAHVAVESAEQLGMEEGRAQLSKIVSLLGMAGAEQERVLGPPA